ncbi:MAG: hypothetical protein ABW072_17375 [Sedimenticola sp.]
MVSGLGKFFHWQPDSDQFVAPLRLKKSFESHLEQFPKGIDNVHIDVMLGAEFISRARLLVRRTLMHEVAVNYWGEPPSPPDNKDIHAFKESYVGMMEVAVDRARKSAHVALIQLLQFSVVKLLPGLVNDEIDRLKGQMKRAGGGDGHASSSRSVVTHERLVILSKNTDIIRYRILRSLFRELLKLENTRLSKLRKSVLGRSWPAPRAILFNPLLQLPSLWADELMMRHYTLVCTDRENPGGFDRVNRLMAELFSDFLPHWCQPVDSDIAQGQVPESKASKSLAFNEIERVLKSALQSIEFEQGLTSWFDSPENIDKIVFSERGAAAGERGRSKGWDMPQWPEYHRSLIRRVLKRFKTSGLDLEILACHVATSLYLELDRKLSVRFICQYLSGRIRRKDLLRRLSSMQGVDDTVQVQKILDRAASAIKKTPGVQRNKRIFSFMRHFLRLRHDLKLAYLGHKAMADIRLLYNPQDIELSRSNGTLHEFVLREEQQPEKHRIRNHVILKADLRGSTRITAQLLEKGLNPASHFSLNFFDPINKLLTVYGANKVFVEGDAVILSVLEYEDTPYQWLCVSHACGLAVNILKVVDRQNIENRKYGLPELELGLGIAFSDQEPAFLYDEEREIMISSAINRADQLSSCSAAVRKSDYGKRLGRGVEVYSPADPGGQDKEASDRLVRYNVNGIELDVPAFYKLKSELVLKQVQFDLNGTEARFLAARYPDLDGKMHWLVVREAPIRKWNGEEPGTQEEHGRSYYQVVSDPDTIRAVIDRAWERRREIGNGLRSSAWDGETTGKSYLH